MIVNADAKTLCMPAPHLRLSRRTLPRGRSISSGTRKMARHKVAYTRRAFLTGPTQSTK
jgi:hypothetical protein